MGCGCGDCESMMQPYIDGMLSDDEVAEAREHLDALPAVRQALPLRGAAPALRPRRDRRADVRQPAREAGGAALDAARRLVAPAAFHRPYAADGVVVGSSEIAGEVGRVDVAGRDEVVARRRAGRRARGRRRRGCSSQSERAITAGWLRVPS